MQKFNRLIPYILLFFLVFGVYTAFLSKSFTVSDFDRADLINSQVYVFSPGSAFVYENYLVFKIWGFINDLSADIGVLSFLQIINALIGAAVVMIFYRLLSAIAADKVISLPVALCLAFSREFWSYSTGVRSGLAGIFFMILGLVVIKRAFKRNKSTLWIYLGLAHFLAFILDKGNVVFILPVIAAAFLVKSGLLYRIKCLLVYLISFIVPASSVAFLLSPYGAAGILSFLPGGSLKVFRVLSPQFFVEVLLRQVKTVTFGKFFIRRFLESDPDFFAFFTLFLSVFLFLSLVYVFSMFLRYYRNMPKGFKKTAVLSVIFLAGVAFIGLFSVRGATGYWVKSLLPVWVIAGITVAYRKQIVEERAFILVFILPLILFTANFFGEFLPFSRDRNIDELRFLSFIDGYAGKEDAFIFLGQKAYYGRVIGYTLYFRENPVIRIDLDNYDKEFIRSTVNSLLREDKAVFWPAVRYFGSYPASRKRNAEYLLDSLGYRLYEVASYEEKGNAYNTSKIYRLR
jgi:hypothetical protein